MSDPLVNPIHQGRNWSNRFRILRRMGFGLLGVIGLIWFAARIQSINSEREIAASRMTGLSAIVSAPYDVRTMWKSAAQEPRQAQISAALNSFLVARTASIRLSVRDLSAAREAIDRIVMARSGTVATMTVANQTSASQTFFANVAIPAAQCDLALHEFEKLGRVEGENQTNEEVSKQSEDLGIRLRNSQAAEERLNEILRMKTDKVAEILEVEKEMARVREEIEQMEAQQKNLNKRVAFASIDLNLIEEYQSQFKGGRSALWLRMRNALVDGFGGAADSFVDFAVFVLSVGPWLVIWGAILFWPARWAWRRWRKPGPEMLSGA
jgi:hypothetical protein